ncbi:MAG: NlpC/P60 family protein [Acidimicrobiia bacterium]
MAGWPPRRKAPNAKDPSLRRRLGVLVGIALLVPVAAPQAASGQSTDDKRAEAARIQADLEVQGERVSVAAERFNRAQLELGRVRASLAAAESDFARSNDRMRQVKDRLAEAAVIAYVHGGTNATLTRLVRSGNSDDFLIRRQYLSVTARDQRAILGELRAAREDLTALRGRLESEEEAAAAATAEADGLRREAVAAEDAQRAILNRVQGELATLVAAEDARRRQEEAARAPAPVAASTGPAPTFADSPAPRAAAPAPSATTAPRPAASTAPPPSSKAAIAVETAIAQIGKPYVYGGSGPDSFDCSGLTAYAWKAAGVTLSHSAYLQYFETTRVPVDQVQPGDLLFFGKDGVESIHHNAIYVGDGQMVEASQTGVPIRYRGWRAGDLVGAGRPG